MHAPNPDKMCKARYTYYVHMYVGSTGEKIFDGKQARLINFTKDDNPVANNIILPYVQFEINMERDEQVNFQNHIDDICLRVMLNVEDQRYDKYDSTFKTLSEHVLFDEIFEVALNSKMNTEVPSTENPSLSANEGQAADPNMVQRYSKVKLLASVLEHRNRTKIAINFNLDNATVAKAVAYGLQQVTQVPKSVIFQNPDPSNETYTQITCPPFTLKDFIHHMQTSYALYKTGVIVYQDLKYLFVIPEWSENYAVAEGEFNRVHFYFMDDNIKQSPAGLGYYKDNETNRYVVVCGKDYKLMENQEKLREIVGNRFRVYDNYKEQESTSYPGESWTGKEMPLIDIRDINIVGSNKKSEPKQKFFHNEPNNPFNEDALIRKLYNQSIICHVDVTGVDMSILTFNRTYEFYFLDDPETDKRYGGLYQLIGARFSLDQQQNDPMSMSGKLIFAYAE